MTHAPLQKVSSVALYRLAKSRWEIENQGFNDGKNRSGMEHMTHHHANSLLIGWLLTCLALTIERLYRLRYLRRGKHVPHTAMAFLLRLWLSLSPPSPPDTS